MGVYKVVSKRTGKVTWYARVWVDGKAITRAVGPRKRDAQAYYGKLLAMKREKRLFDVVHSPEPVKLADYVDAFLADDGAVNVRTTGPKKSLDRDKLSGRHIKAHFVGKYIHEVTDDDVKAYRAKRMAEAAQGTVAREFVLLRRIFREAHKKGLIKSNPAADVNVRSPKPTIARFFESGELRRILQACQPDLREIAEVALHTGLRRGELAKLQWCDVDFKTGLLILRDTKTGDDETVPMNARVQEILLRRFNHRALSIENRNGMVFCRHNGSVWRHFNAQFCNVLKRLGIADANFHTLRHTFASILVRDGVPLPVVKELMRHATIGMTMRYAHLAPSDKRKAVERIAEIFGRDSQA